MKQVYVILSDDYQPRTIMACTSLASAEAIAGHIYGDLLTVRNYVRRVPFIVDTDRLFDDYEYRETDEGEEE